MDSEQDSVDIPKSSKDILGENKRKYSYSGAHTDTPQLNRLDWFDDWLPVDELHIARFDFKGCLLPYKDKNLTINKGLHHHKKKPKLPGHSLQELLQLSKSSTQQKKCNALITLANIMDSSRAGLYDDILSLLPLKQLSQKNILLLLRSCLNHPSVDVVTAALQALRAFLCSKYDEKYLDRLYGFNNHIEPTLTPQLANMNTWNLKDHEIAQLDAVKVLLKSNFTWKIGYILSKKRPPLVGIMSALDILIRIARHSKLAVWRVSVTDLLCIIIHEFMPLSTDKLVLQDRTNNFYRIPYVKAVKLCRVLVTYGKRYIARKLDKLKILQIILTYIGDETIKEYDINLSIESLRLWHSLLHYGIGLDSVANARSIFLSQLKLLLKSNIQSMSVLECEHAAALITVASREESLRSDISTLLEKWNTQLSVVSKITWGVTKLLAEILFFNYSANNIFTFKTTWISNQHFFSTIRSNSNLLCNHKPLASRELSGLPNLDIIIKEGIPLPIVCENPCIPFLNTVLNKFRHDSYMTEIRAIFEEPSIRKYIQDLEATKWNFERSWYSRIELSLLTAMVKASLFLGDTLDNLIAYNLWKIAIKLVSALPADAAHYVKMLLRFALSSEKINRNLNMEIVKNKLAKLDLISTEIPASGFKEAVYDKVISLYENYINLSKDWSQAAMPKDWIFSPLVSIYRNYKHNLRLQQEDKNCILVVLNLALALPDLLEELSPNLRLDRLLLVYLCDTIYLDKDVSPLLTSVVTCLLKRHYARLELKTEECRQYLGVISYTPCVFVDMCKHFCSSSYVDDGFATILLVAIAQRHHIFYRLRLWFKHACALRYLRLPLEKLVVPLKEYLYPEEINIYLIERYIILLNAGEVNEALCPIPYAIALHHSAMFIKRLETLAEHEREQIMKRYNKDTFKKLSQYEPPQLYVP